MLLSRLVPSLAIIIAITGCAHTKIDVDVYKGPLANHEEVQLEQMAVMAVGARPILMRLRDQLEERKRTPKASEREGNPGNAREGFGEKYGTCIQEEIGTDTEKMWREFQSENARRVNAILCLYEDQTPYRGELHARALKALSTYRSTWDNFQNGGNRNWETYRKAMYCSLNSSGSDDCSNEPIPPKHPLNTIHNTRKNIKELINAYSELFDQNGPQRGASGDIREETKKIISIWKDNVSLHTLMERFTSLEGANWNYRFLSNEKLVKAHADLFFPETNKNISDEFVRTVTSIARNFRTARKSLRDLLQINLDILIASAQDAEPTDAQDIALRARTADSIVRLTGLSHFRALVTSVEEEPVWFSQRVRELVDRAKDIPDVDRDLETFKGFLIWELIRNPLETATALREADLMFPSPSLPVKNYCQENGQENDLDHLKDLPKREFGLARVIHKNEDELLKDVKQIQQDLGPAATGLAGGRLNDGLERMINDYLNKDDRYKFQDGKEASAEIDRLRDALVRFAQKMLFVADYDNLLSRDSQGMSDVSEANFREYTQVLQAVGNSILVQANELQARQTHNKTLAENVARARYGAKRVLDGTPQHTIEAIISEFEENRVAASNNLKTIEKDLEQATSDLKDVTKELDPYVTQNLQPLNESISFPEPSKLVVKPDGPLGSTKKQTAVAEKSLCDAFTDHVLKVISARLTLILNEDQDSNSKMLYERIRIFRPDIQCNQSFVDLREILESRYKTQNTRPEIQEDARRVEEMIEEWERDIEDGSTNDKTVFTVQSKLNEILEILKEGTLPEHSNPDYIRLNKTITYLPTLKLEGIVSDQPLEIFKLMKGTLIGNHWINVYTILSSSFQKLEDLQTDTEEKQSTFDGLKASYIARYERWAKLEKERKDLTARIKALRMSVAALNDLKPSVINKVHSANLPNIPSATFLLLKSTVAENLEAAKIERDMASESDMDHKEKIVAVWQTLWDELDGMNPPTSSQIAALNDFKDDKTAREVLDRLISVLNYEHIETIKRNGTSDSASHVKEALRAAYKLRTRLVFIRPASSYLRSSYPAASLQIDPGLEWRNELGRHALKGIPMVGECLTNNCKQNENDPRVLSQIDRQFWQNINSIRVAGVGRTNYVIVQDDIGNWYVKGYSANPEDIIRSVNSLGQFALGEQLDTDLVNRPEIGTESNPAPQPTALEAVFDKYNKEYEDANEDMIKDLKTVLDSLSKEIQFVWFENPTTITVREEAVILLNNAVVHLQEARTEIDKDDFGKFQQVAQRSSLIVMALRAMDRFRDNLKTSIRNNISEEMKIEENSDEAENLNSTESAATENERKIAIDALIDSLHEVVDAKIEHLLGRREETVKAFEKAIVFVGEILGNNSTSADDTSAQ